MKRFSIAASLLAGGLLATGAAAQLNYSEDFETFPVGGDVVGTNGWLLFTFATSGTADTNVTDGADAITGRSAQFISRVADGPDFVYYDAFPGDGFGRLDCQVTIDALGEDFDIQLYENVPALALIGAIQFQFDGTIATLDDAGISVPTTATWTPGTTYDVGLESLPDGTFNVYLDGVMIDSFPLGFSYEVAEVDVRIGNTVAGNTLTLDNITTSQAMVPTPTPTPTQGPPTATPTPTLVPTATATPTVPATATPTFTDVPPTATPTMVGAADPTPTVDDGVPPTATADGGGNGGGGGCAACGATGGLPALLLGLTMVGYLSRRRRS